jgi:hypothetical protein
LIDIAFHTFSQREQVNSEETDLNKNGETGELYIRHKIATGRERLIRLYMVCCAKNSMMSHL